MEDQDDIHGNNTDNDSGYDAESPPVQTEKDSFSGDTPEESVDITEEMGKIGKDIDPEHPEPLGE